MLVKINHVFLAFALLFSSLVGSVIFSVGSSEVFAETGINTSDLQLDVKSAILIEATTGQVLYQYNSDKAFPPASMSKMMTEYLVMEALATKKIEWNSMVPVSKYASEVIGSGQLIAEGEQLSVNDMLTALAVYSSNDASVALAEYVAGSEPAFSRKMNEAAKSMGLVNSRFINATGLSRSDIGNQAPTDIAGETMMSARDVAQLARQLIVKHPEILKITSITSKKLRPSDEAPMINWNWMLEGNKDNINFRRYAYPGLDGLKTGHTDEAGYCFTGTAQRNGMRLIGVVMGAKSESSRFDETRKLLDYGFNQFEMKELVAAGYSYEKYPEVKIVDGVETELQVVTKNSLRILVKKGSSMDASKVAFQQIEETKRTAPIKKGAKLAEATYLIDGQKYQVDLIATQETEEASWLRLFFRAIKDFIVGLFS